MPNYEDSRSEKLMHKLTAKLNTNQNELFSELLEGSAAQGKSREVLLKEYQEYRDLTTEQIHETFRVLYKVLIEHDKECEENMTK